MAFMSPDPNRWMKFLAHVFVTIIVLGVSTIIGVLVYGVVRAVLGACGGG